MDLPARNASLWIAVIAGLWVFGCARTVVPPPASLPSPAPLPAPTPTPATPEVTDDRQVPSPWQRPNVTTPVSQTNPWKPSVKAREWKYIVLHHTASEQDSVESIHEVHVKKTDKKGNHWLGIGYHFVIGNGRGMEDGEIEPTFRWKTQIQGAHAGSADRDYNEKGIGICLVGNFEKTPPTPKQLAAIKRLVKTLKSEYKIATARVVKHSDVRDGGTDCPGKYFPMDEVASGADRNLVDRTPDVPLRVAAIEQHTRPAGRMP